MELTSFQPAHAPQAAEIHAEGQAGTVLTRLGHGFLKTLYAAFAVSPWVFGAVVLDGEIIAGVAVVALDTNRLFREVKRRHWPRLAWEAGRRILSQPSLIVDLVQSMRYPNKLAARSGEVEILFLGLRRSYMRHGIAPVLLQHILDEAYRRGCTSAMALIDRRNRPVRWMISTLPGLHVDQEVDLHGQKMLVYRAPLPLEVTNHSLPKKGESSQMSVDRSGSAYEAKT